MTSPNFNFRNAQTSKGTVSSGELADEFIHPILPMTVHPSNGFLLYLNGYNMNRIQADLVGHDGTASTAIRMLQMRAPRQPIMPLVSQVGTGRTFRPGAKWRYRWKDSRTGEVSGLSPIPDAEVNMGAETPASTQTYLGQTAYFYLATAGAPANADTIQLFANSTQQDDVWYLADEDEIASASYVALSDNSTDDELFFKEYVVTGSPSTTPAGPTWQEGVMWPVCRAWTHPTGRVFYYGIKRFGRTGPGADVVSVDEGSDLCTVQGALRLVEPGRVGQRVRFYTAVPPAGNGIDDPTVYRIIKVESDSTFRVYPEIQVSSTITAGSTGTQLNFAIEDDRDARWTWISEPSKPWLIDPLKVISAGDDYDDGVMAWFALDGRVFMQTRRRIYEAINSISEDPSTSTLFVPRAEEGMPGFECGVETPFGWVFVHERRGIRVFDGATVSPLDSLGDPYADFRPFDQFARFEKSMLESVVCAYDDENRTVIVSYVPTGQSSLKETLCFDTAERTWRGPYRERITAAGHIRSTDSSDIFVTGDDFGNLAVREEQVLDQIPSTVTSLTNPGAVTSATGSRFFTASANNFTADGDDRLRGSPVWLYNSTNSTWYFARIANLISATQFETDGLPTDEDGNVWNTTDTFTTIEIGSIRWSVVTAYVEPPGDPTKPVEFYKLNTRFKRGASSETFEAAAAGDADGTYEGVRLSSSSAPADTRDVNGAVHGELRLKQHGALIQLRVRGLSSTGDPEIVRAILIAEQRDGALAE